MPDTIALIGCGKSKRNFACEARDLYTGPLFNARREWAERFADAWWIASAEHLILEPEQVIEPYDLSLSDLDADTRRWRARQIESQFRRRWVDCCTFCKAKSGFIVTDKKPRVVLLAGRDYLTGFHELRSRSMDRYDFEVPLDGMGIGQQLFWLKEQTRSSFHKQLTLNFPDVDTADTAQ